MTRRTPTTAAKTRGSSPAGAEPRGGSPAGSTRQDAVETRPATDEVRDDVVTVFGTRGDPARCWCQYFRLRGADWRAATTATRRAAMRRQLAAASAGAPPPGVLAYLAGEPVGWAAVAPRRDYPGVLASNTRKAARRAGVAGADDDPHVWAVTCFVVRVGFRRRGVAGALLDGAVDLARARGARAVEGYPVDVTARPAVSSSELYHGSLTLFRRRGFREVARSGSARPVVRLDL